MILKKEPYDSDSFDKNTLSFFLNAPYSFNISFMSSSKYTEGVNNYKYYCGMLYLSTNHSYESLVIWYPSKQYYNENFCINNNVIDE